MLHVHAYVLSKVPIWIEMLCPLCSQMTSFTGVPFNSVWKVPLTTKSNMWNVYYTYCSCSWHKLYPWKVQPVVADVHACEFRYSGNTSNMWAWDFAYVLSFDFMQSPYLVCIHLDKPSLHLVRCVLSGMTAHTAWADNLTISTTSASGSIIFWLRATLELSSGIGARIY